MPSCQMWMVIPINAIIVPVLWMAITVMLLRD